MLGQVQINRLVRFLYQSIAFSDGTHPSGNYDTGIYRPVAERNRNHYCCRVQKLQVGNDTTHVGVIGGNEGTISRPGQLILELPLVIQILVRVYIAKDDDVIGFSAGGVEKASIYANRYR